jgi:hypothetical protein
VCCVGQVGDFLRIGSVGLVVSEINTGSGDVRTITENDLAYLREDVAAIREDLFSKAEAATAAEEAAEKSPGYVHPGPARGYGGCGGYPVGDGSQGEGGDGAISQVFDVFCVCRSAGGPRA